MARPLGAPAREGLAPQFAARPFDERRGREQVVAVPLRCGRAADGILGVGNEGVPPLPVGVGGVSAGPSDVDVVGRRAHVHHE
eukprot:3557537-Pleurochrysis_carterae.AAC.1